MDVLFLLTSFICAIIVPCIHYPILQFKGLAYSFILILFVYVVFAYVILSVYKLKIAKINYLDSKRIVSWDTNDEKNESKKPYVFSLIVGLLFGIFVYFKGIGLFSAILFSLACAFAVLGWWLMGIKRLQSRLNDCGCFLLSHIGIIYNGNIEVFNGYSKGITSAKKENDYLILSILKNKAENELKIKIPENKIADIDIFLNDLKEFFNGEHDEIQ